MVSGGLARWQWLGEAATEAAPGAAPG